MDFNANELVLACERIGVDFSEGDFGTAGQLAKLGKYKDQLSELKDPSNLTRKMATHKTVWKSAAIGPLGILGGIPFAIHQGRKYTKGTTANTKAVGRLQNKVNKLENKLANKGVEFSEDEDMSLKSKLQKGLAIGALGAAAMSPAYSYQGLANRAENTDPYGYEDSETNYNPGYLVAKKSDEVRDLRKAYRENAKINIENGINEFKDKMKGAPQDQIDKAAEYEKFYLTKKFNEEAENNFRDDVYNIEDRVKDKIKDKYDVSNVKYDKRVYPMYSDRTGYFDPYD